MKNIAMKYLFILFTAFLSSVSFAQQATVVNDPHAHQRTLNASFSAITVTDGIELYLSASQEESLAVSYSDEKYAPYFKTVVENGVLKISGNSSTAFFTSFNRISLSASLLMVDCL